MGKTASGKIFGDDEQAVFAPFADGIEADDQAALAPRETQHFIHSPRGEAVQLDKESHAAFVLGGGLEGARQLRRANLREASTLRANPSAAAARGTEHLHHTTRIAR